MSSAVGLVFPISIEEASVTEPGSPTNRDDDLSRPSVPEATVPTTDSADLNPLADPTPADQVADSAVDSGDPVSSPVGREWVPNYAPPEFGDPAQRNASENSFLPAPGYGVPPQSQQPGIPGYTGQYGAQPVGMGYGQPAYQGPTGYPGYGVYPSNEVSPKTKVAGALLAFFLGAFGAHNFYFGKKGRAIAQLIATLCGLALMIIAVSLLVAGVDAVEAYNSYGYHTYEDDDTLLAMGGAALLLSALLLVAVSIWAFVEFILILVGVDSYARDRQGRVIQ